MSKRSSVFVTGASGYIAKHIIVALLNRGYDVTGSVRTLTRATEVRGAVAPHVSSEIDLDSRLRFCVLDLTSDQWWQDALVGSDHLIHTASPVPMVQPKDPETLIRPAVDGTLRALNAAQTAGIRRVVMTSSIAAIGSGIQPDGRGAFSESDWTDLTQPGVTTYARSKTMAENAAWAFAKDHPKMGLTVINPGVVVGTPLDLNYGASVALIERILSARDPMLPKLGFPIVDVRDVAEMHVRALEQPETIGKRFIAADRFMWLHEIAAILKAAHPDLGITTRCAPALLVRLMALFDPSLRPTLPILGLRQDMTSARARSEMGMRFRDVAASIRETGAFLVANKEF